MITAKEKELIRNLARRQLELSQTLENKQKEELWYAHNSLKSDRPVVVMEEITFWKDICPKLQCEDPLAREIEEQIYKQLATVDMLGDDKVIPPYYPLEYMLEYKRYGVTKKKVYASDGLGFHIEPIIETVEDDFHKLSPTEFHYNKQAIENKKAQIEDVIGDILPVVPINGENVWNIALMEQVVELMGTENMFVSMLTEPEEFHKLMEFVTEDMIRMLKFQEEQGCLELNNGNHYLGSGSFCFNHELPAPGYNGKTRLCDTWGHINAQEAVGTSIDTYKEFVLPYYKRITDMFGLLYYGCCEPVDNFWEGGVDQFQNLRKVSISAWANEEYMAERLADRHIIYSRKPSPNFIGIRKEFDEEAFRAYIRKTVQLTKNNTVEFIFRDIYSLNGNIEKVRRAVEITREEISCR